MHSPRPKPGWKSSSSGRSVSRPAGGVAMNQWTQLTLTCRAPAVNPPAVLVELFGRRQYPPSFGFADQQRVGGLDFKVGATFGVTPLQRQSRLFVGRQLRLWLHTVDESRKKRRAIGKGEAECGGQVVLVSAQQIKHRCHVRPVACQRGHGLYGSRSSLLRTGRARVVGVGLTARVRWTSAPDRDARIDLGGD